MSTPHQVTIDAPADFQTGPLLLRSFGYTSRLYSLPLDSESLAWLRSAEPQELSGVFLLLDCPLGLSPDTMEVGGGFECVRTLAEVKDEDDSWERAILLTNSEQSFTRPQIRYLEARLAELAPVGTHSRSNTYLVDPDSIGERERAEMEEYLEIVRPLLLLLGVRLLQGVESLESSGEG